MPVGGRWSVVGYELQFTCDATEAGVEALRQRPHPAPGAVGPAVEAMMKLTNARSIGIEPLVEPAGGPG